MTPTLATPLPVATESVNITYRCYKYAQNSLLILFVFFRYETSDGVSRSEQAELKNAGTENEALVVRGQISWIGADGQQYTISFIADEDGFRPEGAHLPK